MKKSCQITDEVYMEICRVVSSHQNTRLSYAELQLKSTQLANGLRKAGVKKGDRVVMSLGNNIEFAIVGFFQLPALV